MTDYNEGSPTFRLFAVPDFMEGITMALDVAHTMPEFNANSDGDLADQLALASDWRAIVQDMENAFAEVKKSIG